LAKDQIVPSLSPLKILEIVLTAFFITSFLFILISMKESGYSVILFPFKSLVLLIPVFYLTWIYKITFENRYLLSYHKFRHSIYITSVIAVFISLSQIQELMPIFQERYLSHLEFFRKYIDRCFYHPLFCILLLILFAFIYYRAYKVEYYKEGKFWHYNLVIEITIFYIGFLALCLRSFSPQFDIYLLFVSIFILIQFFLSPFGWQQTWLF